MAFFLCINYCKLDSAVILINNLLGIGGSIFTLDELRAHSELPPTLSKMLIYAYYYYYWIENTLKFLKLFELSVSITELIGQANFQTGSGNSGAG